MLLIPGEGAVAVKLQLAEPIANRKLMDRECFHRFNEGTAGCIAMLRSGESG